MNVLLINPPWSRLFGTQMSEYPIGLCYIAGILERAAFNVKVYNADLSVESKSYNIQTIINSYQDYLYVLNNLGHPIWKEIKSVIIQSKPDVIGVSVMTPKFGSALSLAKLVRGIDPKIKVIMGGIHPTICPEETIQNENVDIIVRGEGEITMLELLTAIENGMSLKNIQGISYKENNKVFHNPLRPLIDNLDQLPHPARHLLLGKEEMTSADFGRLFATRGCPYNCIFCASHKIWGRKVRYRSPRNVIDEIKQIKKEHHTNYFYFEDDSFTVNKNFVKKICDLIIKEKLEITWSCETRADLVTEESVERMKYAGCISVVLGAESGSDEILKKIKKGISVKQIKKAVSVLKKYRIKTGVFFMIGFPWETVKEINDTVQLMKETDPQVAIFSIATPYPGTELYKICQSENILPKNLRWDSFFHQSPDIHLSYKISKDAFSEIVKKTSKVFDRHNKFKRIMLILDFKHVIHKIRQVDFRHPQKLLIAIKHLLRG